MKTSVNAERGVVSLLFGHQNAVRVDLTAADIRELHKIACEQLSHRRDREALSDYEYVHICFRSEVAG
jgi:hypothetical protein